MVSLRLQIVFVIACAASAQEFRATLQGSITDASNAVVPTAPLVLRNVDTGIVRQEVADKEGHYLFSFLPPGNYSLTVTVPGFKTYTQDMITLNVSQNARLDIALVVGTNAETISVEADVNLVQTQSSSLGSVVGTKIIDTLPMKGHSSLLMFNLATGITTNRMGGDGRPNDWSTNMMFPANGSPVATSDVAVDGVPNTVDVNHGTGLSPWVPSMERQPRGSDLHP